MKPLFIEEERTARRRCDEGPEYTPPGGGGRMGGGFERPPLREGGQIEAEALGFGIRRAREARPGQGLRTLPEGWFEHARAARYPTTEEAAHACRVSAKLMWHLECGSVTAPELARRIGRTLGLTRTQVKAITCAKTAARRLEEARARRERRAATGTEDLTKGA